MTHIEIINLWPSVDLFAGDVGANVATARKWRQRGRIPSEYWRRVVAGAETRKIAGVSLELLAAADEIARAGGDAPEASQPNEAA